MGGGPAAAPGGFGPRGRRCSRGRRARWWDAVLRRFDGWARRARIARVRGPHRLVVFGVVFDDEQGVSEVGTPGASAGVGDVDAQEGGVALELGWGIERQVEVVPGHRSRFGEHLPRFVARGSRPPPGELASGRCVDTTLDSDRDPCEGRGRRGGNRRGRGSLGIGGIGGDPHEAGALGPDAG